VLEADIARACDRIPGGRLRKLIGCFRSPGVHAVVVLRLGQWLLRQNRVVRLLLTPVYALEFHRIRSRWGIEIPRTTQIGRGLCIGHFGGIIIASEARLGNNVDVSQQVTIGVSGEGANRGCPVIGDNVYIGPGAKVFGRIHIGNNVRIGANAVVHKDVADDSIVVLAPGFRVLARADADGGPSEDE
jgi:serine O-acetyltransferase